MKALSVYPKWADLIRRGIKTIEVRTWSTSYRGPLLICATQRPRVEGLPYGVAVCVVQLVDVRPIVSKDSEAACAEVSPGEQFAWVLESPEPIEFDLPVTGRLGLFAVPDHASRLLATAGSAACPT